MLPNILLFLLFVLHSHARRVPDEQPWNIKYDSDTKNGSEFDRVISGYDFDTELFGERIPVNVCYRPSAVVYDVFPLYNYSGYVYCTGLNKGIKQMCPSGTELSYRIGGCVNKTTNRSVFPIGSRCASQPCQNGGACFDFSSADGYLCQCPFPYKGLHCHLLDKSCPESACGGRIGKIVPWCRSFTTDMALDYICFCYDWSRQPAGLSYAANNCYTDQLFASKCDGEPQVGALSFTNKGFYICQRGRDLFMESCALHHVWNDTKNKCVFQNN